MTDHPEQTHRGFAPPVAPEPSGAGGARPPEPPRPVWPLWSAFAALVAGWLSGSLLGGIVLLLASASGYSSGDAPIGYDLAANLVFDACLVGAAILFARRAGPVSPSSFGLRPTRLWPAVGWTLLAYVVYLAGSLIWLNALGIQNEQDTITTQLVEDPTPATVAGLAVFAVVVAPIVEELFFRGFVFNAMRSKLPLGWAAVATGAMFGVVHASGSPIGFLVPLALLGTVLCLVYWKTGSLLPCIALHCLNNCIALSTALDWGWQVPVLMAGALAAISAVLLPIVRRGRRTVPPATPA
ncbi:MAG: type II CAAX endopeptidase family protein [Solirubrobacteraceae bacterium]